MAAASFLSLDPGGETTCLLCHVVIKRNEKSQSLGSQGWKTFTALAKEWRDINIDVNDSRFFFRQVYDRVKDSENPFGKVHKNCRIEFSTKLAAYQEIYAPKQDDPFEDTQNMEQTDAASAMRSLQRLSTERGKRECFICGEKRAKDSKSYDDGGLGRCEQLNSMSRLLERQKIFIANPNHRFYEAARRLERLQGGQSFDIFAIDVYYHNSCYIKFAINPVKLQKMTKDDDMNQGEADVMADFYRAVRIKIVRKKEAFLLHHLLGDVEMYSEESGMDPVVTSTATLKRRLIEEFGDEIGFFPTGKYVIVHSSSINPCEYSVATLKGHCLRDEDFVRSFANFIKGKVTQRNYEPPPLSADALMESFDNGPLPELYNVIYATMYPNFSLNEHGYAKTQSSNIATKIWSIALDWESLVSRQKNAKQAMLGLTVHRLTGSKEAAQNLHGLGHSISYNDILKYNDFWSHNQPPCHKIFSNAVALHSSIDNNDGHQETITGAGTTHDTNSTLFQPLLEGIANCISFLP